MLSILLVNENKIVSRLFQLSAQKHNYDLEECGDYSAKKSAYNVVFVDSQLYDEEKLLALKNAATFDKTAFLGEKGKPKPDGFDLLLEKPFLPTDFVNLMEQNFKVVATPDELVPDEESSDESMDEFDLDSLEEINLDDDLEEIEEMDLDSLADVETKEETDEEILAVKESDDIKEEISDVLSDIDALDDESIINEDLVKEALSEVEKESEIEPILDSSKSAMASVAAASAVTAVAAATMSSDKDKSDIEELDALDEDSVKEALFENDFFNEDNDDLPTKELESESTSDHVEQMIDSNDLESIIKNAVKKAITKDLIKEALEDMDIVVSFKPKSS